eukprot:TRINITY_DN1170_c0_g1_i1.p1 TRINITY_DN1170_c0_g1~~TRINITY_DN1170_c0_g1_i1.p1  ORF type:complete len:395 (+),score=106.72 TRINITY_DN1170_c0_g1_i1:32-1216(+)
MSNQVVTPWEVQADGGEIDYDRLVKEFGTTLIDNELIERIERVTKQPCHPWLRRGLFFSHRELEMILDAYENDIPFYIYTGRGPSSTALHLGHLIPFQFTQWLQQAFKVPVVIQMTDDEKFIFKENLTLDECTNFGYENAKDIIACGFDPKRTFIFLDTQYIDRLYPSIRAIRKEVSVHYNDCVFGINFNNSLGKIAWPSVQEAPCFSQCFPIVLERCIDAAKEKTKKPIVPCLVPCAIDQDNYFRQIRKVAVKVKPKQYKPALIHSKFLPALFTEAGKGKMSASAKSTCIYVTDSEEEVKRVILGERYMGNLPIYDHKPVSRENAIMNLSFFLENDDELVELVQQDDDSIIDKLVEILINLTQRHQDRRKEVSDEILKEFMTERELLSHLDEE